MPESAASRSRPDSVDSSELKGGDLEAQTRAERTKAKNKRAQKKFRQKQKEKHEELERSAAELSAKLKVTLAELDALQNQKRVLEIALSRNLDPVDSAASTSQVCCPEGRMTYRSRALNSNSQASKIALPPVSGLHTTSVDIL